jgi:hypothetical protein
MPPQTQSFALSPSALTRFLGYEHRTYLDILERRGELDAERKPPSMELLFERGERHDETIVQRFIDDGYDLVKLDEDPEASRETRAARVGTVDKFQGQEAPVVLFSMASSTGDDVARGMSFPVQPESAERDGVAGAGAGGRGVLAGAVGGALLDGGGHAAGEYVVPVYGGGDMRTLPTVRTSKHAAAARP